MTLRVSQNGSARHAIAVGQERLDLELATLLPMRPFALLLRAATYARNTGRVAWDFAVTLDELQRHGFSDCDVRWLLGEGYLGHGCKPPQSRDVARPLNDSPTAQFSDQSVFVLTAAGVELSRLLLERVNGVALTLSDDLNDLIDGHEVPCWDGQRRELRVGPIVVKRFRVPALNQETILAAFEEESWTLHIDDPLPPVSQIDPKRRLHSSIQCLNRNQKTHLLHFHGDGTGCGLRWELCSVRCAAL